MSVQFTEEDQPYVSSRGTTYSSAGSREDTGLMAFLVKNHIVPEGNVGKYVVAIVAVLVIIGALIIIHNALVSTHAPAVEALPAGYSM